MPQRANVGDALDASRAFGHYGSSSYIDRSGRSVLRLSMDNRHRKKNFTPSDDALIRQQPMSGVGLQTLEALLRTNREALMCRADQLGVSLDISDDHDRAVDTRALRCSDGFVDPLLERLKRIHGDRK